MAFNKEYSAYLKSTKWRKIREVVLTRDNHTCQLCNWSHEESGNRQLTVHHKSYEFIMHEEDNDFKDLITICSICHQFGPHCKANIQRFKKSKNNPEK